MVTKNQSWSRQLTDQELEKARITLTSLLIEIDEIKEEKKMAIANFKLRLKSPEELLKQIKVALKTGTIEESREVNLVPDYDEGIMYLMCPETGVVLHSRRLTPSERQLSIQ